VHLTGGAAAPAASAARADTKPAPPQIAAPGVAPTDSAAPPAREPAPAAAGGAVSGSPGAEPYTLQVGAFSTSENARKQKAFFEERGYAAEITSRVRSGKSLYLVWVGSFPNADEARKVLREIQSKYDITPIVVER
jgi:cell division protein FtsN